MEETTLLSWRNFWVVASENTPADRNMFKVDKKRIFQEYNLAVFMISLENIFEACVGVWFL